MLSKNYLKSILKVSLYIFLLLLLFMIFEMVSIQSKYINKTLISFEINNIRNPPMKRIARKIDIFYGKILLFASNNQKKHFEIDKQYHDNLPNEKIINSIYDNFTKSNGKNKNNLNEWHRSHGNHSSNRFSDLKQINVSNINKLSLAWKFQFDKIEGDIQANPIYAKGKIYTPSSGRSVVAINAENGKKIWEYFTEGRPARRGLIYNESLNNQNKRIFFCDNKKLIALNANTGKVLINFGNKGIVRLKKYCQITPIIIKEKLIIATFEPALEVYDLNSGNLLWKYYLKENETGQSRHGGKRYDFSGGNPWGGISADLERGIVFITTGNAGSYLVGVNRPGKNKFSNSIVAIDIINKKKLWDFQEVEHDIWNLDIPAPPILTSIKKNTKKIDVVVAVTKLGNTIILDRLSGKPIFKFNKYKAPLSTIPGEKTATYQPKLDIPEPFAKQFFSMDDVTNISEESKNYVKEKIKKMDFGFFKPNRLNKKNVQFNFNGGAQWMGASVDNNFGIMYVTANNIPFETSIHRLKNKFQYYNYVSRSKILLDQDGYPGSKPPWGTLTSLNLNTGKIIWQIPFGEYSDLKKKGIPITGTKNMGGATGTAGNIIFATGTMDKKLRAFNSKNGKELWSYKLPFIGSGPPTTYLLNGDQYILVASTGSTTLKSTYPEKVSFGNWLYCFKLKK